MTDLSVADVLERAADLIKPEGAWVQRSYGEEGVRTCAKGAISRASGRSEGLCEAALRQAYSVLPFAGSLTDRLVYFNDTPGRTQAEVVAKLREAASLARGSSNV